MPNSEVIYRDHPFITFRLDLHGAAPRLWMLVGEARSKCEHIRFAPLQSDVAREMHNFAFARGVMATTAIEGNTLSLEQVKARIEGNLKLPPSQEYLGIEIDNMLAAYNSFKDGLWMSSVDGTLGDSSSDRLEPSELCELNKKILAGLMLPDGVVPGEFRSHAVHVGNYLPPPAAQVPEQVRRLCEWLNGPEFQPPEEAQQIPFALIKAVVAHVYLEWIHPFGDGNGRLGRLVEFQILISSGVPAPAAHLLSQHYMATRTEYYRQLALAGRAATLNDFLLYATQGWVDQLTDQIKKLHEQAERLMWRALVDEAFGERPSSAGHRQRLIAIELAEQGPVQRPGIRALTEAILDSYKDKGPKTLTRDVNRLLEMQLVIGTRDGYRANLSLVRGMRPFCTTPTA